MLLNRSSRYQPWVLRCLLSTFSVGLRTKVSVVPGGLPRQGSLSCWTPHEVLWRHHHYRVVYWSLQWLCKWLPYYLLSGLLDSSSQGQYSIGILILVFFCAEWLPGKEQALSFGTCSLCPQGPCMQAGNSFSQQHWHMTPAFFLLKPTGVNAVFFLKQC